MKIKHINTYCTVIDARIKVDKQKRTLKLRKINSIFQTAWLKSQVSGEIYFPRRVPILVSNEVKCLI